MLKRVLIAHLMAGTCLAMQAYAQAQEPESETAQEADPTARLATVVVTAQRDAETLQEVPIAVSVVSADALADRGISGTNALEATIPNLTTTQNGVSITPFLRGVGSNQSNPNDEPSVAIYVDGVYIASPAGNIFSFNNIDRIEVLKGPQGTLFGRNATGGVIQIVTRDPQVEPTLEASLGYGDYGTVEASLYGSAGLGEDLAADIAVNWTKNENGYGQDISRHKDIFKRDELAMRGKVLWTPGDNTKLLLSANYSKLKSTGADYQLAPGVIGADGVTSYPGKRLSNTDYPNQADNETQGEVLRWDQDLGFARLVSISSHRKVEGEFLLDQDATPVPIVRAEINQYAENYAQELQLLSPVDSAIDWLIGAYYFDAEYAYRPLTIRGLGAAPFVQTDLPGSQDTKSTSVYGQATIPVMEKTDLTVGLRYTTEDQSTIGGAVGDGVPLVSISQEQGFDKLTWRLALDHQFTPEVLGYVSYNRGIKSGGFNMINAGAPGYNPEILDAYEVGLKTELFDRSVRFNSAVFFYDYKDIQVFSITGGGAVLTENAAAAELFGFDADLAWQATPELVLSAGLGYIDSEYTDFPNATFTPPSPLNGPQFSGDATGNSLIYAPEWSGNLAADYSIDTRYGRFLANGSVAYRDDAYVSAANRLVIPAYTVANASFGWRSTSDTYGVKIWVRNLFDEEYYANRTEQALGDIQYLAPPRVTGITFDVKY